MQALEGLVMWKALDLPLGAEFFRGYRRVCLEVGFGNGEHLAARAAAAPDELWLGAELNSVGVHKALRRAQGLSNVRVFLGDAWVVADVCLPANALDEICIHCPDPWPKNRHAKHRLLQPDFFRVLRRKARPDAHLLITTDHPEYGTELDGAARDGGWQNLLPAPGFALDADSGPATKYQRRWRSEGIPIRVYRYERAVEAPWDVVRKGNNSCPT